MRKFYFVTLRCHRPRRRAIQYAAAVVIESRGRGALNAPVPSPPRLRRGYNGARLAGALAKAASRGMTANGALPHHRPRLRLRRAAAHPREQLGGRP